MNKQDARFKIENARLVRLKALPSVAFLRLHAYAGKYPSYFEVKSFSGCDFGEGDVVNVTGDLRMAKPRNGGKEWTLELIVGHITKGDQAAAPPDKQQRLPERPAVDESDDVPF